MSAKEFGELLQSEAINGTTIYFIPAAGTSSEKPFPVEVHRETEREEGTGRQRQREGESEASYYYIYNNSFFYL